MSAPPLGNREGDPVPHEPPNTPRIPGTANLMRQVFHGPHFSSWSTCGSVFCLFVSDFVLFLVSFLFSSLLPHGEAQEVGHPFLDVLLDSWFPFFLPIRETLKGTVTLAMATHCNGHLPACFCCFLSAQ